MQFLPAIDYLKTALLSIENLLGNLQILSFDARIWIYPGYPPGSSIPLKKYAERRGLKVSPAGSAPANDSGNPGEGGENKAVGAL